MSICYLISFPAGIALSHGKHCPRKVGIPEILLTVHKNISKNKYIYILVFFRMKKNFVHRLVLLTPSSRFKSVQIKIEFLLRRPTGCHVTWRRLWLCSWQVFAPPAPTSARAGRSASTTETSSFCSIMFKILLKNRKVQKWVS